VTKIVLKKTLQFKMRFISMPVFKLRTGAGGITIVGVDVAADSRSFLE